MRMRIINAVCGAWYLLLALWVSGASAAEWHQVEVIAFRYPAAEGSQWAAVTEFPNYGGARRLAETNLETESVPAMYTVLTPHELQLVDAYKKLRQSPTYQPIFHVGWRQNDQDGAAVYLTDIVPDLAAATPPIGAPTVAPTGVEGTVRIAADRIATRVTSNFLVRLPESVVAVGESRAIVAGELHYLDHPLLGLIVQVTHHNDEPEALAPPLEPNVEAPR